MKTLLSIFILSVVTTGCYSKAKITTCPSWLDSAILAIESIPPNARYKQSLIEISRQCNDDLPLILKKAAQRSLSVSPVKRSKLLQNAAASYFSSSCLDSDSTEPASKLNHICLGKDFIDGSYTSITENISVAAYMFGKAIENELNKSKNNPEKIKKFMLNYFLGAAQEFETFNKH